METIMDMPFDLHSSKLHGIDCGDNVLQKRVHQIIRAWQMLLAEREAELRHHYSRYVPAREEEEFRRLCAEEVSAAIESRILERHVGELC